MPPAFPRLARILSAAAIILGAGAATAAAKERITLAPSNWVEITGVWAFNGGKYSGRPGPNLEALTVFNSISDTFTDYFGTVTVSVPLVPKEHLGDGFVLLRGKLHTPEGGERTANGYFAGLTRTPGSTTLAVFRRNDGKDKVLCSKVVHPKNPAAPQVLDITVGGSTILVQNSGASCRAVDRMFDEGIFGFWTGGGNPKHLFKVLGIDLIAR